MIDGNPEQTYPHCQSPEEAARPPADDLIEARRNQVRRTIHYFGFIIHSLKQIYLEIMNHCFNEFEWFSSTVGHTECGGHTHLESAACLQQSDHTGITWCALLG